MKSVSRKQNRKKETVPPKMDTLSLDGSECYYDLDTFVKLPKTQSSNTQTGNESAAKTAKKP